MSNYFKMFEIYKKKSRTKLENHSLINSSESYSFREFHADFFEKAIDDLDKKVWMASFGLQELTPSDKLLIELLNSYGLKDIYEQEKHHAEEIKKQQQITKERNELNKKLNVKDIIEKGFVTIEEMAQIDEQYLTKLNIGRKITPSDTNNTVDNVDNVDDIEDVEGIWIYPLEDDCSDKPFHFVFYNNLIAFYGSPRAIFGMIGIAHPNKNNAIRATAYVDEHIALFKSYGEKPITYYNTVKEQTIKPITSEDNNEKTQDK